MIWKIILLGIAGQFVSSFDLFLQNTINLSKKLEIFYWEMLWNPYKISTTQQVYRFLLAVL